MTDPAALTEATSQYRPDIDGLRAFAVLAVIAYHYAPGKVPGGFIGVDIFFVISGYLITGILARQFKAGTFSLLDFYERRVRRIFPALSLILIFCLIVGWLVLFPSEYKPLGQHIAAGAGFVQNLALWREAGYFDVEAIEKPLLHLWSLAVEEQYYILWPVTLWFIMRRHWPMLSTIAAIGCVSFALNLWGVWSGHPTATFYLPLSRAWELMAGAWLAVCHQQIGPQLKQYSGLQCWLGLLLVTMGIALIRPDASFPGFWAALPVLGTALLINAGPATLLGRKVLSLQAIVWIGLISYPLYLWHWVLWSMATVVFGEVQGFGLLERRLIALTLSLALSWLTYRYFERPVRRFWRHKATASLALTVAVLGLTGFGIFANGGMPDRPMSILSTAGDSYLASAVLSPRIKECSDRNTGAALDARWYCVLGDPHAPTWILSIGDSHARSMIPAMDQYGKEAHVRVISASMSSCVALLDTRTKYLDDARGPACATLIGRATAKAINEHAAAVVITQDWAPLLDDHAPGFEPDAVRRADSTAATTVQAVTYGLRETLARYQSANIPVVLMEDNPHQPERLPRAALRFDFHGEEGALNKGAITRTAHAQRQARANGILESLAARYSVASILNIDAALCNQEICPWAQRGKFLYFNRDHLSVAGSLRVTALLEKHLDGVIRASPESLAPRLATSK